MTSFAETRSENHEERAPDFSGIDASDLARLHELSFRLLQDCPLGELLDDVLSAAIALLDADMGNIQLHDSAHGALTIVAQRGFKQDFVDFFNHAPEGTGCCGTALKRGERIIVEDVERDPIFAQLRPVARNAGYRAVQSTPLRTSRGLVLGMLSTHFREPRRPTELQLRLLDLYAQQAERVIERKQAEDALRAKERQLRLVTDTPVIISHIGRDLRYKFVNRACAQRIGKEPDYFIGKSIEEIFGRAVLEQARPNIERVLRGETFESESEIDYPQIGRRFMRSGWTPERDADGEVVGWVGTGTDITERKRAERQIQQFRFAVENSTEFIGMCDLKGQPFFVNTTALEMVGLESLEQAQKVEVKDFFFEEDQPFIVNEFLPKVLRDGHASVEIRFRHFKTGEALWMCYSVVTLKENGAPTGFATISQNITERKRADLLLRESEERNRKLIESVPQLVWTCGPDGGCDYLSPQWVQYTGEPEETQLGSGWARHVDPQDAPRVLDAWSRAVRLGCNYTIEFRLRGADGAYRWFATRAVPMRNTDGAIVKWIGTSMDIDERRRAEAELRESQERLAAALAASRTGTFRWNIHNNGLEWDDELDRLFGLTPGESARSLSQFISRVHAEDRPPVIAACERCAREGADFHEEFRVVWPDGSIHWLDDKGRTFRDQDGKPAHMTGACIDITERKKVEAELLASRETLRLAQEVAQIGTFEWNIPENSIRWSPDLERIYGLQPGAFGGTYEDWSRRVHPEDLPGSIERIEEARRSGSFSAEWRVIWPDGSIRWLEARAFVFKDEHGEPLRMIGVNFDVTRRKLAEQELHEAREKLARHAEELEQTVAERTASLKEAVAQMEEFSYSVSHDLRAPIRAMNQYAKLLVEEFGPTLGERGLHFATRIVRSSERMNQLTMDTLNLSRIARTSVELTPISLDTVVSDIIGENQGLQPPHATIEIKSPLGVVAGNTSLLTQAISNLLVNAVKFVPAGVRPAIRIWTESAIGKARLLIQDNGIGVAPEHQHRLFGIFQRVHPAASYEGTGIGLAIVRKAAERLGGAAGMISDGSNGSTFWIELQHP